MPQPVEIQITRFQPLRGIPLEESERHYVGVHIASVRNGQVRNPETQIFYHSQRVIRQFDVVGTWNHRITTWRFVKIGRIPPDPLPGLDIDPAAVPGGDLRACANVRDARVGGVEIGTSQMPFGEQSPYDNRSSRIDALHLRALQRTVVSEEVLLDRRSGQPTETKYMFEYDRYADMSGETARARVHEVIDRICEEAKTAEGFRLLRMNWVEKEAETAPIVEEGQAWTGRLIPDPVKVGYLEVAFDNDYWGDLFFRREGLPRLLLNSEFRVAEGYHLLERTEFDRR